MKDITNYINESDKTVYTLWAKDNNEKYLTINVDGSKNISSFDEKIQVEWDPHSGIYFTCTSKERLIEFQKLIKEETIILKL